MKFEDSFTVPVPVPEAWDALTDIERVYPCLPGAELREIADDEFRGTVTLRLGPITATYDGTARFESLDRDNSKLVILAQGRDKHGQGTARARVQAELLDAGDEGTRVEMVNEVDITGKAAQFGRGIIVDVSKEIMAQFVANLREVVTAPPAGPEPDGGSPVAAAPAELDVGSVATRVARSRLADDPLGTLARIGLPLLAIFVIFRRLRR